MRSFPLLSVLLVVVALLGMQQSAALDMTWISDIHYDPLYGTPKAYGSCTTSAASALGMRGCDAPLSLIRYAIEDVSNLSNAFTVFGGDWQRHKYDKTGLSTTYAFTNLSAEFMSIKTTGLNTPANESNISITIGNNDLIYDYFFNYSNSYHDAYLNEQIAVMEAYNIQTKEEGQQMNQSGFYVKKSDGFNIITINTFLWTFSVIPSVPDNVEDPGGQFVYLEQELESAASQGIKVIVVGHVPPSVNGYGVISKGKLRSTESDMYWKKPYQDRYNALLKKYSSTVITHLYGHTHVFTILAFEDSGVPGFVMPSISPVFGNNANYFVASFSNTWELEKLSQRYLHDNGNWIKGDDLSTALGYKGKYNDVNGLRELVTKAATDDDLFMKLLTIRGGGYDPYYVLPGNECQSFCRAIVVCGSLYGDFDNLKRCTETIFDTNSNSVSGVEIAVTVVFIVVAFGAIAGVVICVSRYRHRITQTPQLSGAVPTNTSGGVQYQEKEDPAKSSRGPGNWSDADEREAGEV